MNIAITVTFCAAIVVLATWTVIQVLMARAKALDRVNGVRRILDFPGEVEVQRRPLMLHTARDQGDDVAHLWREFDETLVHSRVGTLLNTHDADHHFRAESLAPELVNNRVLLTRPAVLTVIGVLGTFTGGRPLHNLGQVCLHPGLVHDDLLAGAPALELSARTATAVSPILDAVRAADEKAIVFVRTKIMQRALATWLRDRYGVSVDIVNGDTPATGSADSRVKRIRRFEARPGFGVIIMSPLAVGVGLTVVGANHAIHLERHWNPAKEAQATDRVYRIGQTRPVHVYYPMALHPDVDSFDVNLDRLLRSKVALSGAVMVPEKVTDEEIARGLGLR